MKLQAAQSSVWSSSRCLRLPLMPTLPPLISYHLLTPSITLFCSLNEYYLLSYPLVSLLHCHLSFLYALPMSSLAFFPCLFLFPCSSHHTDCLLALGPCCSSSLFTSCISRLFLWGASCVCSPLWCVIWLIKWVWVDHNGCGLNVALACGKQVVHRDKHL